MLATQQIDRSRKSSSPRLVGVERRPFEGNFEIMPTFLNIACTESIAGIPVTCAKSNSRKVITAPSRCSSGRAMITPQMMKTLNKGGGSRSKISPRSKISRDESSKSTRDASSKSSKISRDASPSPRDKVFFAFLVTFYR